MLILSRWLHLYHLVDHELGVYWHCFCQRCGPTNVLVCNRRPFYLFIFLIIFKTPDGLENPWLSIDINQILLSLRELIIADLHCLWLLFLHLVQLLPLGEELIDLPKHLHVFIQIWIISQAAIQNRLLTCWITRTYHSFEQDWQLFQLPNKHISEQLPMWIQLCLVVGYRKVELILDKKWVLPHHLLYLVEKHINTACLLHFDIIIYSLA